MALDLYRYSPDIDAQILEALSTIFTGELQTQVALIDPLYVKTIRVIPLQDDPTLTAPYVTYGPNYEKGIESITEGKHAKEFGEAEIGGPIRFLYHYSVICGTPIVTTREVCSAQIGNLATRVAEVLARHFDLSGVLAVGQALESADSSKWIEGANKKLVDGIKRRLKGGEQTWFGEAEIEFHYPVSWDI